MEMEEFTLIKNTDPILTKPCELFDFNNSKIDPIVFFPNMMQFMINNNGIGLAAPQIGLSLCFFIMKIDSEEFICINPRILEFSSEYELLPEGCLSFPFLELNISRPKTIKVEYYNEKNEKLERELTGLKARCFQHEFDHLNGITFDKKISKLVLDIAKRRQKKLKGRK